MSASSSPSLLIVNAKSRSGEADFSTAVNFLREQGVLLIEKHVDDPRAIVGLIRDYAHQVERIILGGGDGTLNAAAEAIVASGLPLGILPMGTANDLARTLGIPLSSLVEACRVITQGRLQAVDVGCVNDKYFFNVANIGLGVRVTHNLTPELKRRWGVLGYVHSLIRSIRQHRSFHAEIVCDGQRRRIRSIQIGVGNGRFYGGGMIIAEDAAIDDHRFFFYSLKPLSFWKMIALAPALRLGRHGHWRDVLLMHGREIEIHTRKPMAIDTDGELVTHTPARFRLLPKVVSVYVPPNGGPGLKESSYVAG